MATGWNELDDKAAETLLSVEEGDVIETNIVKWLQVTKAVDHKRRIGSKERDVRIVEGEGKLGGRHRFMYWYDPKVTSSETGKLLAWDHAVLVKRYRKRDNSWMNNSDSLTHVEVIGHIALWHVSMTMHKGVDLDKDDFDTRKQAWLHAKSITRPPAEFEIVDDANADTYYVTDQGDYWSVSMSAAGRTSVRAETADEAAQKAKAEVDGRGWHSLEVNEVRNEDTGEYHSV